MSGVLPRKDYAAYYGSNAALLPGQLIDCVVAKAAAGEAQVVTVSVSHDAVAAAAVKDSGAVTLGGLLPGSLVTVKVRAVLGDGLLVTFLTFFNGAG